jgi:uncharacterized protein
VIVLGRDFQNMLSLETARAWYPDTDPVHGFDHIKRVYRLAEQIALAEGADLEIVRAAALLHDVEGSPTLGGDDGRRGHQHASANLARLILTGEGWPSEKIEAVEHCIRAHRFREQAEAPVSLEAQILFDADKLDAIGAVGVARAIAYAITAGQPVYAPTSRGFITSGQKEEGEPHSAYHEYIFKLSRLRNRMYTKSGRQIAAERHRVMEDFFAQLSIEMGVSLP